MPKKHGNELLDEAAASPTLDDFMKRDTASLTPTDRGDLINVLRHDRAAFIRAEDKKQSKKEGIEDDD